MRIGIRSILTSGRICRAMLLALMTFAMVFPGGDVAFSQNGTFTFTTFDVPNSAQSNPYGINDSSQIVGLFLDASNKTHGFLDVGGTFTTIDVPNAIGTSAIGINTGQIVGYFTDASNKTHGFLRDVGGTTFTTIDVLNAITTNATGINGTGQIAGSFLDASNIVHGFVRAAGGTITTFDFPSSMRQPHPYGINNTGQIVGYFVDASNIVHGFVRAAGGTFTTIDPPNSLFTEAFGINEAGQIVGVFQDSTTSTTIFHGFLMAVGGTFTRFDVLNAIQTVALGINNTGQIVGYFVDTSNIVHDFLANGKPDPVLTVPQWFQAGIPAFDSSGNPMPGNGYPPGNFWATLQYDFDTATPNSTIQRYGCALTALTTVFNFLNGITNTPMCTWTSLQNPPICTWPGLPPSDPRDPTNSQWPNRWVDLFHWEPNGTSKGLIEWDNWASWEKNQEVRVYRECGPNVTDSSCSENKFKVVPQGAQPISTKPLTLYSLDTATQTLVNLLRNGVPLILPILNGGNQEKHWVVVKGWNSKASPLLAQFLVNDPGDAFNVRTLNDVWSQSNAYAKGDGITQTSVTMSLQHLDGWKVYVKIGQTLVIADPNTPQSLGIYSGDPVEFVLTDPLGRRTGFDPVTNTPYQEIPSSDYSTSVYSDEQDFSFVKPPFKALDMANQMNGQYTLNVIGTASSSFTVEVRSSDAAGNWIVQTYSGITAPGVSSQFTFQGTATTFAALSANVAIKNGINQFAVGGQFTLGTGSPGINPLTQPVTLQVGTFVVTIPAGSFHLDSHGNYVFQGTVSGVQLAAGIQPQGGNRYAYGIAGQNATNLPTMNPVEIRFATGSNGGKTSVNANFLQ